MYFKGFGLVGELGVGFGLGGVLLVMGLVVMGLIFVFVLLLLGCFVLGWLEFRLGLELLLLLVMGLVVVFGFIGGVFWLIVLLLAIVVNEFWLVNGFFWDGVEELMWLNMGCWFGVLVKFWGVVGWIFGEIVGVCLGIGVNFGVWREEKGKWKVFWVGWVKEVGFFVIGLGRGLRFGVGGVMVWFIGRDIVLGIGVVGGGGNELGKEIGFFIIGLGRELIDGMGGIMVWGRGGKIVWVIGVGGGGEIFGRGLIFFCLVFCFVGGGVIFGMGEGFIIINLIGFMVGVLLFRGNF